MSKLSVIIPVYNTEDYLSECLDSFLCEKTDAEIILVESFSSDRSGQICDEYAENHENVSVIHEKCPVGIARNIGLTRAGGKYVYFADSDDVIVPDALEKMIQIADLHHLDLLRFGAENFADSPEFDEEVVAHRGHYIPKTEDESTYSGVEALKDSLIKGEYTSAPWAYLFRRSFLMEHPHPYPDLKVHEDTCTIPYIWLDAERVRRVKDIVYMRRMRPGSLSHDKVLKRSVMIYAGEFERLLKHYTYAPGESEREVIVLLLKRLLMHALLVSLRMKEEDAQVTERLRQLKEAVYGFPFADSMINWIEQPEVLSDGEGGVYFL